MYGYYTALSPWNLQGKEKAYLEIRVLNQIKAYGNLY